MVSLILSLKVPLTVISLLHDDFVNPSSASKRILVAVCGHILKFSENVAGPIALILVAVCGHILKFSENVAGPIAFEEPPGELKPYRNADPGSSKASLLFSHQLRIELLCVIASCFKSCCTMRHITSHPTFSKSSPTTSRYPEPEPEALPNAESEDGGAEVITVNLSSLQIVDIAEEAGPCSRIHRAHSSLRVCGLFLLGGGGG